MKFNYLVLTLCGILLTLGFSCGKKEASRLYILDVNSAEIYNDAHIKGAVHSDLDRLEITVQDWDKSVPVIVYCSNYMCTASGYAAQKLHELGFKDVRAYEGGIAEWYQLSKSNAEYIVEGPAQQAFLAIVLDKPVHPQSNIKYIEASDLQKIMKQANIL
jgi:rhodanese-related sulfurtransferase